MSCGRPEAAQEPASLTAAAQAATRALMTDDGAEQLVVMD